MQGLWTRFEGLAVNYGCGWARCNVPVPRFLGRPALHQQWSAFASKPDLADALAVSPQDHGAFCSVHINVTPRSPVAAYPCQGLPPLGQLISFCCTARVMAFARLDTPSLDRMLLT